MQADTAEFQKLQAPWFGAAPGTEEAAETEWNVALLVISSLVVTIWLGVQIFLRVRSMKQEKRRGAHAAQVDGAAEPSATGVVQMTSMKEVQMHNDIMALQKDVKEILARLEARG